MPNSNLFFNGSLCLTNLDDMLNQGFYLADIPLFDARREVILLNQQRKAEVNFSMKLEEAMDKLRLTHLELESAKKKSESLLYQMLPVKVASQLKETGKAEAEKFNLVTILFSDIVAFTNIAAACTPLVIVNMLNKLYNLFDEATNNNKVYKVETIGDAYMAVGGVPEYDEKHADRIANQAIDMIQASNQVMNPVSGKPLQIRVGIHSGPVVAGVVGMRMPRYCLFGDTVNTASRMESHGLPGQIHVSQETFE